MTRRHAIRCAAGAFSAAVAAPYVQTRRAQPNVVMILTDDHGYQDLGCFGGRDLKTPAIDSLAAGGARFTSWYSNAPMCAPSRASLMTGRYPQRCKVPGNSPTMPADEVTLGHLMKSRGYATGVFGKWHLGPTPEGHPNSRGFDEFFGFHTCNDHFSHRNYWSGQRDGNSYHDLWHNRTEVWEEGKYSTELWTAKALQFINANRSKPFFVYLPYSAVHYPMHAPRKYLERFTHIEDPERRIYAAMLACVDDGVAALLETLQKHGLRDNTLIAFTSDNGATRETRAGMDGKPGKGGSNLPYRGAKFSLFDGGIRVPGILHWPSRIAKNRVIEEPVMTADIFPTFAAAVGARLPQGRTIDGRDLLPVTEGARSRHGGIFWSALGQVAVRRGNWKYIRNPIEADGTPRGMKPLGGDDEVFLADIVKDPGETRNVRKEQPAVAAELGAACDAWLNNVKQP